MADNNTANPPAASGGLTREDVAQLVADGIAAAVKPLTDNLTALSRGVQTLQETQGKGLTAETVKQVVAEQLQSQNAAAAEAAQKAQQAQARAAFVAKELKGVPAIYTEKLGGDPAKWGEEGKAIRDGFAKDLEAQGIKPPPVSGDPGSGAGKVSDVAPGNLTGIAAILQGVKETAAKPPLQAPPPEFAAAAAAPATPPAEGGKEGEKAK